MYAFMKSLIILHTGVVGTQNQPICHSPPPTDNEEEVNFFVKNHFPLDHKRKRLRRTMKRIPDELGKNYFKRLIELHEAFKDGNRVITRAERAEAIELYRKIDIHMLRPREILMLQKLKQLRSFFIKRRFKYFKRKQTDRIEWRTLPIYSIKKHSPFTHDEIVIMCVGNGKLHYIGKLTRKEILLLTETAEEYHKNGLLSIDNDKAYVLGTIMPLIKVITTLHISVKMRVLNSIKYGKTFHNKYKYLLHKSKQAMAEAALLDKNIGIKCKECSCFKEKRLTVGGYKSDPFTFTRHLMGQLTKIERLAKASVRLGTLRRRVIKNFMFKMWEYKKLGRKFFRYIPTRDLTKLKTTPGNLYFNTLNTPYGIPHFAPISLYRVVQYAIAGKRLRDQCVHRLRRSHELLMIIRRLQKYTSLSKLKFMTGLCDEMVNKCINYMFKYKNTFRKLTKPNKSVQEKRKLRLRARRLEEKYTMLARFISKKLQGRLANHPRFRKEMLAHYGRKNIKKSIYASTRRKVKSKKDVERQNRLCDEEDNSPMMLYRNSIDNLKQGPCDINSMKEAVVRRYKTLISELKERLQLMDPKTLPKKNKSKKKKWYAVIRSMYRNAKLGKVNSHNISKSFKVWRKFNAHIQDLMDDFSDYIERLLACKMNQWPPKDEPKSLSYLFEFERPKTKPKPVEKLDECTYNKKLRVLVNNKNKKILGGYRALKLGTDWTSKYHEIIQRKFIKVGHFNQQKDSYVIQAGKMAAKGCEKVVKKCLYALSIFGFEKKDLELALLIYAKIRIIVKMEPKVLFPCKNKLIEAGEFLNTKYQIYNEAIEEHRQKMSKIKPQFISWRRRDNNFMNKVLVEQCSKPKLLIENFFYGLDPRHVKSRKFIAKNELFDLSDYKYYDYKSDDDFSNKLDYSSDSSRGEKINMIDCCICEGKEELRVDKTTGDDYNPGRTISNALDLKKLIHSESFVSKENLITIIQDHNMSLRGTQETQSKMEENKDFETFPDLYINTNNYHKNPKKAVLKCINLQDHDKFAYKIKVPSDNDSSSTSFDTKFRRSYFEDKEDMKDGIPHIIEPDLRIQGRRKEKREKLLLRLRLGGEHYWQKTPKKLEGTFEKYLKFKLSHLQFKCQYYKKPFIPEYHPIYYLRDLPVIKEPVDTSLTFMTVANFRRELFKKVDEEHYGTDQRRGTEDIERCSILSDSDQSLTLSHTGSEKSTKKSESETLFDNEKLFVSKYDDTYQNLKGYDFLELKEEVRNEIENFKQLLRYEKECLVQNAHSNDVLMKIAKRAEKMHPTEESLFSKSPFIHEPPSNYQRSGSIRFDPNEWQDYFSWIENKVSYQHVHLRDIENHTE